MTVASSRVPSSRGNALGHPTERAFPALPLMVNKPISAKKVDVGRQERSSLFLLLAASAVPSFAQQNPAAAPAVSPAAAPCDVHACYVYVIAIVNFVTDGFY
jgi:hypothetical protein